jgi:hypothetical protein
VARYEAAAEARDAARRLLAAGVTPEVRREDGVHVLMVAAADVPAAAGVLDVDPEEIIVLAADDADLDGPTGQLQADAVDEVPTPDGPDDTADLVVDERGFVVVTIADDVAGARDVAASLLEQGIGAEVVSAFETGHANPMTATGDPQAVQVLEIDTDRALALLGHEAPPPRLAAPAPPAGGEAGRDGTPTSSDEVVPEVPATRLRARTEREEAQPYLGGRVMLTRRQARTLVTVYVAAVILIPIGFYLFTRWALAPDVEEPELRSRFDIPSIVVAPPPGMPLAP